MLNNLGFLYTEKGELDKARSALEQAEKISRGRDSAVYANFGLLYEVQGKLQEALKVYRKAGALNPASDVYAQKIEALEKQLGKQDQGLRDAAGSPAPADQSSGSTDEAR
jgi:tetratricopeptide (TPR) repeat protein